MQSAWQPTSLKIKSKLTFALGFREKVLCRASGSEYASLLVERALKPYTKLMTKPAIKPKR